jgi:hypothetical protein
MERVQHRIKIKVFLLFNTWNINFVTLDHEINMFFTLNKKLLHHILK